MNPIRIGNRKQNNRHGCIHNRKNKIIRFGEIVDPAHGAHHRTQ